ncbi:hypothetical protein CANARDRAFT_26106 [[Candida] arabinofermentans NRRL YB-2248]|uniref:Uncharacterized protein n=1 Tax=[Candida] arabinofermentans NRRL YB-2248 TaxID=983967 RepID=A0A1E4T837_9ASCO|nr:hypothetical protein CANARDRAFT_26106 [[Candida] arabinofermentans NRRL YB-2248]
MTSKLVKPEQQTDLYTYELDECIPVIDAILKASDLESISVKKIRKALSALFDRDFESTKKQVNALIMDRFYKLIELQEKSKDEDKDMKTKLEELLEENRILSARLNTSIGVVSIRDAKLRNTPLSRADRLRMTKEEKQKRLKRINKVTGLSTPCALSPTLATFLKTTGPLPRTEVVKRVWAYIRENDLQDPEDKRFILCDDALKPLFGDKVHMFTMNKFLKDHLTLIKNSETTAAKTEPDIETKTESSD